MKWPVAVIVIALIAVGAWYFSSHRSLTPGIDTHTAADTNAGPSATICTAPGCSNILSRAVCAEARVEA